MGTSGSISELDPIYQGAGLKIGIVMSRFNKDICEGLLSACETELTQARRGHATTCCWSICPVRWSIRWCCKKWPSPANSMR